MYFYRMSINKKISINKDINQSFDQSSDNISNNSSNETFKLLDKTTNKIVEVPYDKVIKLLYKDKVCIPPNLSKKEKEQLKVKLSENNYWTPLYDVYSDNLYVFQKDEIYGSSN